MSEAYRLMDLLTYCLLIKNHFYFANFGVDTIV